MQRRPALLTGILVLLSVGVPAASAPPKLDHGGRSDRAEAYRVMSCTVRARPALATNFLKATEKAERDRAAAKLVTGVESCVFADSPARSVSRKISFGPGISGGIVAEALLAKMPQITLPPLPLAREYQSPWKDVSGRDIVLEEMAVCVAATNPAGVTSLLATELDTSAEKVAVSALQASLTSCLSAAAVLNANVAAIRAALAEALYHRVAADLPLATAQKN